MVDISKILLKGAALRRMLPVATHRYIETAPRLTTILCTMPSPDYKITTPLQSLSPHSERRYLFPTGREWRIGLLVSAAAGAGAAWVSLFISVWIGVTVFLVTLTASHMRYASRFIVPLPHIGIFISALQYEDSISTGMIMKFGVLRASA